MPSYQSGSYCIVTTLARVPQPRHSASDRLRRVLVLDKFQTICPGHHHGSTSGKRLQNFDTVFVSSDDPHCTQPEEGNYRKNEAKIAGPSLQELIQKLTNAICNGSIMDSRRNQEIMELLVLLLHCSVFVIGQPEYQLSASIVSHLAFDCLLRTYYFRMLLEPHIYKWWELSLILSSSSYFGLAPSFLKSMAVVLTVLNVLHTMIILFHLRWCDNGAVSQQLES